MGVIAAVTADGRLTLHRASPFLLSSASAADAGAAATAWQCSQARTVCTLRAQRRVTAATVTADWGCRLHIACATAPGDPMASAPASVSSLPQDASMRLHHTTLKGSPFLPRAAPATAAPTHSASQALPAGHRVLQILSVDGGSHVLAVMHRPRGPGDGQPLAFGVAAFTVDKQPLPSKGALRCAQNTPLLHLLISAGAVAAGTPRLLHATLLPARSGKHAALLVESLSADGTPAHVLVGMSAPTEGWHGTLQVRNACWATAAHWRTLTWQHVLLLAAWLCMHVC